MAKTSRNQGSARTNASKSTKRARLGVKAQPSANQAWRDFQSALALALGDLDEDEYLVLSVKPTEAFVQFISQGSHGMRAEAVSNTYLPEASQLSPAAAEALVNLGWNAPTYVPTPGVKESAEGSPNFYIDAANPVPYSRLAALAASSLRKVYGARHPGELEYTAKGSKGMQIRFPALKVKRSQK